MSKLAGQPVQQQAEEEPIEWRLLDAIMTQVENLNPNLTEHITVNKLDIARKVVSLVDYCRQVLYSPELIGQVPPVVGQLAATILTEGGNTGISQMWITSEYEARVALITMRNAAELGQPDNEVATKFCNWLCQPASALYSRSTAGDYGGRSWRSDDGGRAIEAAQVLVMGRIGHIQALRCEEFTDETSTVITSVWGYDYSEAINLSAPTHVDRAIETWETQVGHSKLNQPQPVVETFLDTSACQERSLNKEPSTQEANLFALAATDPYEAMCSLWPNATESLSVGNTEYDFESLLLRGAAELHRMIQSGAHPRACLHWAVYDCHEFRRKGTALAYAAMTSAHITEHLAPKVQRGGSRNLSIQTPTQRLLQDLVSSMGTPDSTACLTGVAGDAVQSRMINFAHWATRPINPGGADLGSRHTAADNNAPPTTSILQLMQADTPEYTITQGWEREIGAATEALMYKEACKITGETLPVDLPILLQACAEQANTTDQSMADRFAQSAKSFWYMRELNVIDLESVTRAEMTSGMHALFTRITNSMTPNDIISVVESDTSKFTPAGARIMNTLLLYYPGVRTDHAFAEYACCVLRYIGASATLYTMPLSMLDGCKPHGSGCQCGSADFVRQAIGAENYARMGVADTDAAMPSGGPVSQGFSPQNGTLHVRVAAAVCGASYYHLVNGDDNCLARTPTVLPSEIRRHMGDTYGSIAETLSDTGALARVLAVANLNTTALAKGLGCASGGLKISLKKTSLGTAGGSLEAALTIVFETINLITKEVTHTRSPIHASSVGEVPERSLAGLVSHWVRAIRLGGLAQGDPADVARNCVNSLAKLLPNLQAALARVAGRPASSIWTGTTTIITNPVGALHEIINDAHAPEWARLLATKGYVVLPKGKPVGKVFKPNDRLGAWLNTNVEKSPYLGRALMHRAPETTISMAEWLTRGYHLSKPITDLSMYLNSPVLDCTNYTMPGSVVMYHRIGNALPKQPSFKISTISLKPWTGGSMYNQVPDDGVRGAVISSEASMGAIKLIYSPAWNQDVQHCTGTDSWLSVPVAAARHSGQTVTATARYKLRGFTAAVMELGNRTELNAAWNVKDGQVMVRYATASENWSHLSVAVACAKALASRLRKPLGHITRISASQLVTQGGTVLGSGEQLPTVRCQAGFYRGQAKLVMTASVVIPPIGAVTASRTTLLTLVAERMQYRHTASVVQHTIVGPPEMYQANSVRTPSSINSEDFDENVFGQPSINTVLCGGPCSITYTPADLEASLQIEPTDIGPMMVCIANRARYADFDAKEVSTWDMLVEEGTTRTAYRTSVRYARDGTADGITLVMPEKAVEFTSTTSLYGCLCIRTVSGM
jgi:hypothetical protein